MPSLYHSKLHLTHAEKPQGGEGRFCLLPNLKKDYNTGFSNIYIQVKRSYHHLRITIRLVYRDLKYV